jgi:hypothetical protein
MFSQTKENDRRTIMSSITSLNYFKGFSVMRTANVKESAEWLICTADKIQRELNFSGRIAEKNQFCENEVEEKLQDTENSLRDSSTLQPDESHTPPDYCTVVKKEKGKNITPENIGTIFLCQIPLVHSVSAVAIMQKFSSFQELINSLVNNPNCLNDIYTETNGKKRKLSKAIIQNIKKYLGISTII